MNKLILIVLSIFITTSVFAEPMKMKSKKFSSEFNKMKSLAGTWKGMMGEGDKKMPITVSYKVASAGSSIVETTFPGLPMEMVSVYTDVKGKVNMTHYCSFQNQPTLRLQGSTTDTLEFDYVNGANMDVKKDAHMHHLTLKFKDKNTIEQHWTQFKDGKSSGKNVIVLTRSN
jgi:hypothetical protein